LENLEHFYSSKTPPDADFTYLVKEIGNSVLVSELLEFFSRLKKRMKRYSYAYSSKVFLKILDMADTRTQEILIDYLKQEDRDIEFLNSYPDKISQLNFSETDIRELWKKRIFDTTFNINPFNIFAGLLRNNLIPKEQIDEANKEMFNHFDQINHYNIPENKDIEVLKTNGFFKTIFQIAIVEQKLENYMWVNSKCGLIISFIENFPLNETTVGCIFEMSERANYSKWLVRDLKITFLKYPYLKTEFHKIAT